jgi:hypothetical protein
MVKKTCKAYKMRNTKTTWIQMCIAFVFSWLILSIDKIDIDPTKWGNWKKPMVLILTLVLYPYFKKWGKEISRAMTRWHNRRLRIKRFLEYKKLNSKRTPEN